MMPLDDIRVVELGHVVAGPFAATLLGDFGAEVIKVERPGIGDGQRGIGPVLSGQAIWFSVVARNKKSVTLDLQTPDGRALLGDLLQKSDVLVENFRPGVLERLGFGPETLRSTYKHLVVLRVSGFGQTGPYRDRRGFGKVAEAYSGATALTGFEDRVPVHPGYSLGDLTTGLMGAYGVLLGLAARARTGAGQVIDLALYESLLRLIDWNVAIEEFTDLRVTRRGNSFPFDGAYATDIYVTNDGGHIAISASSPRLIANLRAFVARVRPDRGDGSLALRDVSQALGEIVCDLSTEDAQRLLDDAGVIAWPVFDAGRILADPHMIARENIVRVPDACGNEIPMPAVLPKLGVTPGAVRSVGPALGAHTEEVLLGLLGRTEVEVEKWRSAGVI